MILIWVLSECYGHIVTAILGVSIREKDKFIILIWVLSECYGHIVTAILGVSIREKDKFKNVEFVWFP